MSPTFYLLILSFPASTSIGWTLSEVRGKGAYWLQLRQFQPSGGTKQRGEVWRRWEGQMEDIQHSWDARSDNMFMFNWLLTTANIHENGLIRSDNNFSLQKMGMCSALLPPVLLSVVSWFETICAWSNCIYPCYRRKYKNNYSLCWWYNFIVANQKWPLCLTGKQSGLISTSLNPKSSFWQVVCSI